MKPIVSLSVALIAFTCMLPAQANTFRCKGSLIEEGDTKSEILAKCGKPDFVDLTSELARAPSRLGGTFVVGVAEREVWTYERGSGEFPAILTFDGITLERIEFIKTPGAR
jgi:hypothetical protein